MSNDLIKGTRGDDVLVGQGGDDTILGGGGDDLISGDLNFQTVLDPSQVVPFGDDVLGSGLGEVTFYGDLYRYSVAPETDDPITTLFGDDTVFARDGDDTAFYDVQVLTVTFQDRDAGPVTLIMGNDVAVGAVEFGYGDAESLRFAFSAKTGMLSFQGGDDRLFGRNVFGDTAELLVTGQMDPKAARADIVFGDDHIQLTDNDAWAFGDVSIIDIQLTKGTTPVRLVAGDDTIISGEGDDHMWGDFRTFNGQSQADKAVDYVSGADTFVFAGDFGLDFIYDFEPGKDRIQFEGYANLGFADLNVVDLTINGETHVLVSSLLTGPTSILLQGDLTLSPDDFAFV